jgi:tetratricopeptide (TPR) repeat protein
VTLDFSYPALIFRYWLSLLLSLSVLPPLYANNSENPKKALETKVNDDEEAKYLALAESEPSSHRNLYNLGVAQFQNKKFKEALESFKKAALASEDALKAQRFIINLWQRLCRAI